MKDKDREEVQKMIDNALSSNAVSNKMYCTIRDWTREHVRMCPVCNHYSIFMYIRYDNDYKTISLEPSQYTRDNAWMCTSCGVICKESCEPRLVPMSMEEN